MADKKEGKDAGVDWLQERVRWIRTLGFLGVGLFMGQMICGGSLAQEVNLPRCLVYFPPRSTTHAIVVEKAKARLSLFRKQENGFRLVKAFPCALGRVMGEKTGNWDERTPTGIYAIEGYIPRDKLPRKYGSGALVLNYPNFFDRIENKVGYGIWIHGTPEPERIQRSRDTDGCIVVSNHDLREVVGASRLFETPVIVQDQIVFVDRHIWLEQQKHFMERLQLWLWTWEPGGIKDPKLLYSDRFRTDPLGAGHLLRRRKALVEGLKRNRIRISDLYILRDHSTAVSTFVQEWETDFGSTRWTKALYWSREGHVWRAVGEEFLERPPKPFYAIQEEDATS